MVNVGNNGTVTGTTVCSKMKHNGAVLFAILGLWMVSVPLVGAWSSPTVRSTPKMGLVSSVSSVARRARESWQSKERSREDLKIGIAGFYDRSSKLWEDVWGEHMHHGYYVPEDR